MHRFDDFTSTLNLELRIACMGQLARKREPSEAGEQTENRDDGSREPYDKARLVVLTVAHFALDSSQPATADRAPSACPVSDALRSVDSSRPVVRSRPASLLAYRH